MRSFLPVFAYSALIFWLSSLPALDPPGGVPHLDKFFHLGEYGILGFLLARAWFHVGLRPGIVIALTLLVGGALAGLDEYWQGQVGRQMSVYDWAADCLGIVLAAVVCTRLADEGR